MLEEKLEEDSEVIEIKVKKRTIKVKDSAERCQIRRNNGIGIRSEPARGKTKDVICEWSA